LQHNKIIMVID